MKLDLIVFIAMCLLLMADRGHGDEPMKANHYAESRK
jgi:hypothetical protein